MSRIEELQKEIEKEKSKDYQKLLKNIEEKYGLKVGDVVEFIDDERDGDYDYKHYWRKGEIYRFEEYKTPNGEIFFFVKIKGYHNSLRIDDVNLFVEDDFTLRHSLWDRVLDIGDKFQLIVDKPKSAKGKIYEIEEVHKKRGENIEYIYYNDNGKPQSLYENEYHITHE